MKMEITMAYRALSLPVHNPGAAEPQLNGFRATDRVPSLDRRFAPEGERSFWSFCADFVDARGGSSSSRAASGSWEPGRDGMSVKMARPELDARGQDRRDGISGTSGGRCEMTLNQFRQGVRREPFRPFNLVLVDGRVFTVDHPEFVAIDRRGGEVTFYTDDNTQHFIDAGLIAELVLSTSEKPARVPPPEGA